jgi:hypothetical protein
MKELGISAAELQRRSTLSVNTIRGITGGAGRPNTSTLIAVSAVLEWPWNYLINILDGRPDKNVPPESPAEAYLAKIAAERAEIAAIRAELARLTDVMYEVDRKLDQAIESQHPSDENPQPPP